MADLDAPDVELKTLAAGLRTATDEVKRFAETANTEIKNLGKLTDETKAAADKALSDMNGIGARLTDIEQKMARRGGAAAPIETKSLGQTVVEHEDVKSFMAAGIGRRGTVTIEVKNITSASTSGTSGTTGLVASDRVPGINLLPQRRLVVRDLLTPGNTNSSSIDYVRETLFTNNAATVAENPGSAKPQSDITFELKTLPVRTIAHFVLASKQILADAPQLQTFIDGRLRYGLAYAEDLQFLVGDGTGTNLLGLMPQATAYAAPSGITVASPSYLDTLRLAMLQATLALYPATGTVLNPTDWAAIELTKDSQNRYIWGVPQAFSQPTLWNLPVVESLAMPQNNFLTGAFRPAAQIFDREDANVLISTEDRDNFVKNMVTILAEERTALAVYRPQALITGTFHA